MKKGIIVPIYKGDNKIKKTPLIASDWYSYYHALKVFEKILQYIILDVITSEIKFPNPQQQGFQRDLSCITAGFNLEETIYHYNDHESSVYVAFLYCKKAYGICREGLMVKLQKLGIKG